MIIAGPIYDAEVEARRLVEEARLEADRVRETARREGFLAGREEGLAEITAGVLGVALERARSAAAAEADLRRLAVRIAERLLGHQLAVAPEMVADIVRAALAAARSRAGVTLRVHPEDLPLVDRERPRLAAVLRQGAPLALVADPLVERGGCVVDTGRGVVDARLSVQLAAIERALCEVS